MNRLVLLATLVLASGIGRATAGDPPVSMAAVDRAISLASQYLVGACGQDGKFVYEVDTADGRVSSDYNVVRHAGAMYALAMANGVHLDSKFVGALRRSAGFLRAHYIRPGPLSRDMETLAVWDAPPTPDQVAKATLGATGLGLVGLIGLANLQPSAIPVADLKALGQFLLFLQRPDGSFRSKYFAREHGKFTAWGSLYYPGEAALALVSLYKLEGSKRWLAHTEAALSFLAKSRVGAKNIPADNWALIATAKLFSLPDQSQISALRAPLVAHAVQICESILAEQIEDAPPTILNGAFNRDGRTTPTSTRLEGLQAALEFLPPEQRELRMRIEKAVTRGIQFLLRAQIQTGRYAGGVPAAVAKPGDSTAPSIRIDYVQHFLSAMIRYRKRFAADAKDRAGVER